MPKKCSRKYETRPGWQGQSWNWLNKHLGRGSASKTACRRRKSVPNRRTDRPAGRQTDRPMMIIDVIVVSRTDGMCQFPNIPFLTCCHISNRSQITSFIQYYISPIEKGENCLWNHRYPSDKADYHENWVMMVSRWQWQTDEEDYKTIPTMIYCRQQWFVVGNNDLLLAIVICCWNEATLLAKVLHQPSWLADGKYDSLLAKMNHRAVVNVKMTH